jgi:hypothetical protein
MGWTHNWQHDTELPTEAFARAAEDCSRLLGQMTISLSGPDGTGQPVFRPDAIAFNGTKPLNCEPFEIHQVEFDRHGRRVVRSFCKTEHLPYDLCVQLALIVLKHQLANTLTVQSDGTDDDWAKARAQCQELLGYGEGFRLSRD